MDWAAKHAKFRGAALLEGVHDRQIDFVSEERQTDAHTGRQTDGIQVRGKQAEKTERERRGEKINHTI